MRRVAAVVLAQALVVSAATGSSLHVHEYVGHDHPDHHHGPATHAHEHSTDHDPAHHSATESEHETTIEAERCEPGRHAVTASMVCSHIPRVQVDLAELAEPTVSIPNAHVRSAVRLTDVRVHGPPLDAGIPPRAPPVSLHA